MSGERFRPIWASCLKLFWPHVLHVFIFHMILGKLRKKPDLLHSFEADLEKTDQKTDQDHELVEIEINIINVATPDEETSNLSLEHATKSSSNNTIQEKNENNLNYENSVSSITMITEESLKPAARKTPLNDSDRDLDYVLDYYLSVSSHHYGPQMQEKTTGA